MNQTRILNWSVPGRLRNMGAAAEFYIFFRQALIRPSLKGGLCMSAGKKKLCMSVCLSVCDQSLRLGMSGSSSHTLGMGNNLNEG